MPAGLEVRPLDPDRFAEWRKVTRRGFGNIPSIENIERRRRLVEMDRCFAVTDGGQIVGTGSSHTFRLTIPGGESVPAAGIASVATSATHRRRGVMTAMVKRLLEQARERAEPVATLCPSESGIYGRFGFGPATLAEELSIQREHCGLADSLEAGSVRYAEPGEARKSLPEIWEKARPCRAGWLDRNPAWWEYLHFREPSGDSDGPFFLVHSDGGVDDGYAIYDAATAGPHGDRHIRIRELVAISETVRGALWGMVLGIDLAVTFECTSAPVDDPLWWMLNDPRRLARRTVDGLWVRLIDVPAALSARRYYSAGRVAIRVIDAFETASGGTFALETDGTHRICHPTNAEPDILLRAGDLGAIYLGATPLRLLAAAGRAEERKTGTISLMDRMFLTAPSPWCPHEF